MGSSPIVDTFFLIIIFQILINVVREAISDFDEIVLLEHEVVLY